MAFDPSRPFTTKGFDPNKPFNEVTDVAEQEGMAAATMAADEKFKVDNAGGYDKIKAGMSMVEQGVMPWADEIRAKLNSLSPVHKYILGKKAPSYAEALKLERQDLESQKKMIPSMATPLTIAGGMISPVNKALGASSIPAMIGKGAGMGAMEAAGFSEADNAKDLAKDTALGAVVGGAIPGLVAGVQGVRKAGKTAARGFGEGTKAPDDPSIIDSIKPPEWTGLPAAQRGVRGVKGAFKAVGDQSKKMQEFDSFIKDAKPPDFIGTNEDFVLDQLLQDGENATKAFFARKSATVLPGQIDSEALNKIYSTPMEARAASQKFNKIDAGEDLLEGVTEAHRSNTAATGEAYGRLNAEARAAFEGVDDAPTWDMLKLLEEAAERPTIGGGTKNVLEEAFNDLGGMGQASPAEQFAMLQKVRQKIDLNVNYHNPNRTPEGEKILKQARANIDKILKSSSAKVEGDKFYSVMKDLDTNFFEKLGTKRGGKIVEFDPTKIEDLFGNTKSNRRLWRAFEKAKEAVASGKLAPEQAGKLKAVLKQIDDTRSLADTKKIMTDFRHKQGPTSPEVQRQSAAMKGSKPLTEAVESPAGFIHSADQFFPALSQEKFGKSWSQLENSERSKLIQLWTWMKKNPDKGQETTDRVWDLLSNPGSRPPSPFKRGTPSLQGGARVGTIQSDMDETKRRRRPSDQGNTR